MTQTEREVGIVGAGSVVSFHHLPILQDSTRLEPTYVADIDFSAAKTVTTSYDARPIEVTDDSADLPSCDIAFIATPLGVRKQYIREFSDRGTPIMTEKPFAVELETHDKFIDTDTPITCDYSRLYYSAVDQLKFVVENRLFGPVREVSVSRSMTPPTGIGGESYKLDPVLSGGGILVETGCHPLSQLDYIFEASDLSVEESQIAWQSDLDVEVRAQLTCENDAGSFPIDLSLSMIHPDSDQFTIEFETACITWNQSDPGSKLAVGPTSDRADPHIEFAPDPTGATTAKQAMYRKWEDFVGKLDAATVESASETRRRVTRLIESIYETDAEALEI